MNIYIVLIILPVVTNYGSTETSKEPPKKSQPKTTIKPLPNDAGKSVDSTTHNPKFNSVWFYPPIHAMQADNIRLRQVIPKTPRSLTKLAKTFYSDFIPSFSKDYFEPFERRSKPVTLITFRRNGAVKRNSVKVLDTDTADVAQLQSPYNDISIFWRDEPEETFKMS